MKPYIAQTASNLRLMLRDRAVLFYSYLFPLVFFFSFAQVFHAGASSGEMARTIAMVMIIGVLGSGFFGAGIRTVLDRETNVLRRFKVAPISAGPIIVASMISGWVAYMPTVFFFLFFGKVIYHAPLPAHLFSLILFISIGLLSFRAMGMIIAAVVNSQQEATIIIQLLYLPMLFLSGATFPTSIMPDWVQIVSGFLPATYLFQGMTAILLGGESAFSKANLTSALCLLVAMAVALVVGIKLFRWEKEEKISGKAKLWIVAVLAPFFIFGIYQGKTKQGIERSKQMDRAASQQRTVLFRNVKIFVGNGEVIQNGAVLIKNGKIAQVFRQTPEDTKSLNADEREEAGKTLLPGLIDMQVHLDAPGGVFQNPQRYNEPNMDARRLAAYLYSGITAVRSVGDRLEGSLRLRETIASGKYEGADLYVCGTLKQTSADCVETEGSGIQHVSAVDLIPVETFASMKAQNIAYDPTLSALEARAAVARGDTQLLNRPSLQEVGPTDLLADTRTTFAKPGSKVDSASIETANQNLLRAYQDGVTLITGSDAGNPLVIHGPTIQHELALWVNAKIPAAVALQAATYNAAKALHQESHMGLIREGMDATFILVDGDPLQDISATEHINAVYLRGEHIERSDLFDQFKP